MIDPEDWSEEELEIFALYDYKCVNCRKPSEVIHEDVPKSLRPKTWMDIENRSPLCVRCHRWAHYRGTVYSSKILKEKKRKFFEHQI